MKKIFALLPAYNEAEILSSSLEQLNDHAKTLEVFFEVLIVENGSSDNTFGCAQDLTKVVYPNIRIQVISSEPGLGNAIIKGGLNFIFNVDKHECEYLYITGMDLPFGIHDIRQFKENAERNPGAVFIGSKLHRESFYRVSFIRKLSSYLFFLFRFFVLGRSILDSQGTFFIHRDDAKRIWPYLQSKNYFITTEIAYIALCFNIAVTEVPIVYEPKANGRPSKVNLLKDTYSMIRETIHLRKYINHILEKCEEF